jgi:hypothetical protein
MPVLDRWGEGDSVEGHAFGVGIKWTIGIISGFFS